MKKIILIFVLTLSLNIFCQNAPTYPNPDASFKRVNLLLPKIKNEKNLKVEIKFSIELEVIECSNANFSFNPKNLIKEYGISNSYRFPFYKLHSDAIEITEGLDSDCTSNKKIIKKIFSSQNIMIDYQSNYSIPFYIPESWNLEYRLWKADEKFTIIN